jgi:hypothetical protein
MAIYDAVQLENEMKVFAISIRSRSNSSTNIVM